MCVRLTPSYPGAMFASLGVRNFRYLWVGTSVGHIGFWMQVVAQGWLAFEMTGSGTFLGLLQAAAAIPALVFMLPSGVMADRWDRRGMIFYSNLTLALSSLVLTAVVAWGVVAPWHLVVLAAISGLASALNIPARHALGPQLAGATLTSNAVALSSLSFNASRVLGPAVAGILIAAVGLVGCFVVQTLLMAVATGLTGLIAAVPARNAISRRQSIGQNFLDGLRCARDEPVLWGCIIVSTLHNLFGMAYAQLMPVFAGRVLDVGGAGLGALMTAAGMGAAMGALAAVALSGDERKGIIMFSTSIAVGAAILAFSATQWVPLALGALIVLGCTQAVAGIATFTILNLAVPEEYRGRVNSIFVLTWNFAPLAALPFGWVADGVGAPISVGTSGLLTIVSMSGAALWLSPVRRFHDRDYAAGHRITPRRPSPLVS